MTGIINAVLEKSVIFVLVSIVIADPDPTAKLPAPPYTPAPPYHPPTLLHGYTPRPTGYGYARPTGLAPAYPPPRHQPSPDYGSPPKCAKHDEKLPYEAGYCLEDEEYPAYEIQHAVEYHYAAVAALYKDVLANTENSVDGLTVPEQETYLCPSHVDYIRPLRAINTEGQWRIIVNNVKAHYETLSQTARVEHCLTPGHHCPLVPECYETKCIQKTIYHRFLVYDPYDYYFPFAIESFPLPLACSCHNGHYSEPIIHLQHPAPFHVKK